MNIKEWAAKLNGRKCGNEITSQERKQMKQDGVVAVYGAGGDLCSFNGVISDIVYYEENSDILIDTKRLIVNNFDNWLEHSVLSDNIKFKRIKACFHYKKGYFWTFETDIPHETFDIYEHGELFCKGIIFKIADCNKPRTNFERIKAMSVDDMAAFIGKKPFCVLENDAADCIYGWHNRDCQKHAKCWLESEVKQNEENV